jgi:hypothetical protein
MKNVLLFLQMVTQKFPPITRHAHLLTLRDGKLELKLLNATPCWRFVFDPSDVEKNPEQLLHEITILMAKTASKPIKQAVQPVPSVSTTPTVPNDTA